jgi:hypothetical protein
MRLRLPLAAGAVVALAALSACVPLPPADEAVLADLGTVQLEATVPGGAESIGAAAPTVCLDAAASWRLPGVDDPIVTFATTSATTACPEQDALNGSFPTWASPADLPQDARPVDVPAALEAHRLALDATVCTNGCTTTVREVALLVLEEGTVLVLSQGMSAERFDDILATIRVVD